MTGLSLYNFKSNFLDLGKDVIWVFWGDVLYDGNCFEEEQEERNIKVRNKTKCTIILNFMEVDFNRGVVLNNQLVLNNLVFKLIRMIVQGCGWWSLIAV